MILIFVVLYVAILLSPKNNNGFTELDKEKINTYFQKIDYSNKNLVNYQNKNDYFLNFKNIDDKISYSLEDINNYNNFYIQNDVIKTKCRYMFYQKNWYIVRTDMEVCSKDEAIKDIDNIIDFYNIDINNYINIKKTWK